MGNGQHIAVPWYLFIYTVVEREWEGVGNFPHYVAVHKSFDA